MSILLHIDASARRSRSHSRRLSAEFVRLWQQRRPDDPVLRRDLGADPPSAIAEGFIAAAFTPPADRTPAMLGALRESEMLVDELERADVIVLGTPMYNYGMPAALKAWVDQVIRVGRAFSFDPSNESAPLTPLMTGKTLVVVSSRGEFGFQPGGVRAHMNHLDPHLATLAPFLGVTTTHLAAIEYDEFKGPRFERSVRDAETRVAEIVSSALASRS
jgi:FMN-dependent NADH-azoreductase